MAKLQNKCNADVKPNEDGKLQSKTNTDGKNQEKRKFYIIQLMIARLLKTKQHE